MFTHCANNLEKHVIEKNGSNTIMIICKKLRRILLFSVTFCPLMSHTFHQTGIVFRLLINSKGSSFLIILGQYFSFVPHC